MQYNDCIVNKMMKRFKWVLHLLLNTQRSACDRTQVSRVWHGTRALHATEVTHGTTALVLFTLQSWSRTSPRLSCTPHCRVTHARHHGTRALHTAEFHTHGSTALVLSTLQSCTRTTPISRMQCAMKNNYIQCSIRKKVHHFYQCGFSAVLEKTFIVLFNVDLVQYYRKSLWFFSLLFRELQCGHVLNHIHIYLYT